MKKIAICLFHWLVILMFCIPKIYSNINVMKDSVTYYSEKIVIFWCPTENELNLFESDEKYSHEEEMDDAYYNTEAMNYAIEHVGNIAVDTNSFIRFVVKNDTIVLKKQDFTDLYFSWKVILFDGRNKPIVIAPIDILDDRFLWFFKK